MSVHHITDDEYENAVIKSDKPVLVDFWAPWCGPCRMVGPLIEDLSEQMPEVKFCKVDIDENSAWAAKLGIMNIPTMLIYRDGEVVAKQIGALTAADLKAFVQTHTA